MHQALCAKRDVKEDMVTTNPNHLEALRAELNRQGLDGFVVPLTDEHMSEYVGDYAKRLAWLTGFQGSAGWAVVLQDKAAIFIDGRYTIQVQEQVDEALFSYQDYPEITPVSWVKKEIEKGKKLGFDPWLHSISWVKEMEAALAQKGARLIAVKQNPVDAVWDDQPLKPKHEFTPHDKFYAGKGLDEKLGIIAGQLDECGADYTVLAALDSIAWAFNIRGRDIENTPVGLAFAIIAKNGRSQLFTDLDKITADVQQHLNAQVDIIDWQAFKHALQQLSGQNVLLDPSNIVSEIFNILEEGGANIIKGRDPAVLPKACKNEVELDGARAAHKRDGAAVSQFLSWFSQEAPKGELDELTAAGYLENCRRRLTLFQDLSFRTISAAGPHAAIPHYSVTQESNLRIDPNSVFLVDSGGQYLDGTTDITRTIAVGEIKDDAKMRFTLVLKGHIALATARFPKGTPGRALDTLARYALWQSGLDFDHGTGHGVGSFLSVHEGPQRIAKAGSDEPLREGMILSNEPGYYKAGDFGIRIENLVIVVPRPMAGDEREMLGFETITFAPIDQNMIVTELLSGEEKAWLDDYHQQVRDVVLPQVDKDVAQWLEAATQPLN